jgi:hypothetical protein
MCITRPKPAADLDVVNGTMSVTRAGCEANILVGHFIIGGLVVLPEVCRGRWRRHWPGRVVVDTATTL